MQLVGKFSVSAGIKYKELDTRLSSKELSKISQEISIRKSQSECSVSPGTLNEYFVAPNNLLSNSSLQLDNELLCRHDDRFHFRSFTENELWQTILSITSNAVGHEGLA